MGSCRRPNEHAPSGDCRTHIHSTPWAVEGNNTPTEHLNVQQLFSTRTMGARVPNSLSSQCRAAHLRLQELNAAHLENDTFFFGSGKVTEILSLYVTQLAPASDMAATQRSTQDERRTTCASRSLPMPRPRRQRHVTLFDSRISSTGIHTMSCSPPLFAAPGMRPILRTTPTSSGVGRSPKF